MAFKQTIDLLKSFRYARYMPRLYLKAQLSDFEAQSQRNVGGFMKGCWSSGWKAVSTPSGMTLRRFIASYDRFIEMLDDGTVYISKALDVYDLMERDDEDEIQQPGG